MSDEPEYPPGIPCPQCQRTDWLVTHTRRARKRVRRFRTCTHCGHKVRTVEVLEAKSAEVLTSSRATP